MITSLVPPPISMRTVPNFFSLESSTDDEDANGSNIKPSISISHFSRHVVKSFSIFLAIVTKCTFDSSLCPDRPIGFLIPLFSSTLKSCDKICRIFLSCD